MSHCTTVETTSIQSLPDDLFDRIFGMAPQLGLTNKRLYSRLPPRLVLREYLGITFPSVNLKLENLVKINHGGITFSYNVPANPASNWNGITPSPHGVGGRHIHTCDFCEKIDNKTIIFGNPFAGGVLFVCSECKKGLTPCLIKIMGEHLWNLVDGMQQIMVPRSNGSTEMWYPCSRLPTIYRGEWHLSVKSHRDLRDLNCLSKDVPVKKLKELNNPKNA